MSNPGEKKLSDLYYVKRKTLQQIADIYGVTRERVRQWMEWCDLPRNKRSSKILLDESNLEICDKYIKGESVDNLAKKNKVSKVTLYNFLHRHNPNIRLERKKFREKMRGKR